MVFYCELAAGFCTEYGVSCSEDGYLNTLVSVFEQALKSAQTLPANTREGFFARLGRVRDLSRFGYGVGEEMDDLLAEYAVDSGADGVA